MGIEIIIGKPVPTKDYKDCYMIEIEFMHGDGDFYVNETMGGFDKNLNMVELKEAIIVCERMQNAYPHGRGGYDEYNEELVPGYNKWFNSENEDDELFELASGFAISVPTNEDCQASFRGYEVVFYNENGIKFDTKIKFIKE